MTYFNFDGIKVGDVWFEAVFKPVSLPTDIPFNVGGHPGLTGSHGNSLYSPVNKFLSCLNSRQLGTSNKNPLENCYEKIILVANKPATEVDDLIRTIHSIVADFLFDSQIVSHAILFCRTDASIVSSYPNLTQVGSRPGDTEEKTFRLESFQLLTALSLVAKIMLPIWATIGDLLDTKYELTRDEKLLVLYDLISPLLRVTDFNSIMRVTDTFIRSKVFGRANFLGRHRLSNEEPTLKEALIATGGTMSELETLAIANFLVKRIVTFGFVSNDPSPVNIIAYLSDMTLRFVDVRYGLMKQKMRTNLVTK